MSKTQIIDAVQQLDVARTRRLLDSNPSLLAVTDRKGRNLLHLACSVPCGDLRIPESAATRMAGFLLRAGIGLESTKDDPKGGGTPLWFAVARGRNATLVRFLLKRGAAPTRIPGGGLFAAGWYDDVHILNLLVRAGVAVDVGDDMTPFLACWSWQRFRAAKFLALKGADVNRREPEKGKTALHIGVEKAFDPALLAWLVKHGASPDIPDRQNATARQMASRKRNKQWLASLQSADARTESAVRDIKSR